MQCLLPALCSLPDRSFGYFENYVTPVLRRIGFDRQESVGHYGSFLSVLPYRTLFITHTLHITSYNFSIEK
jgi:hypothetical protein